MMLRWAWALAFACFAIGTAAGVVMVDDHPNAQKLEIAADRVHLQTDQKVITDMVMPCMRLLAATDGAVHREGGL